MAQYADTDLQTWRKARMDEPVPPIRTCDYLVQTSVWAFWGTPDELKDKPRYYISDDDRLYWWDGSDEVQISEETDVWLKKLAVRHREIVEKISASSNQITQFKDFMQMLVEIHKYFYNLLPIESMFYEFVDHLSQVEYAAGIELIKQLSEQEDIRAAGDVVRKVSPNDLDNKNVLETKVACRSNVYMLHSQIRSSEINILVSEGYSCNRQYIASTQQRTLSILPRSKKKAENEWSFFLVARNMV